MIVRPAASYNVLAMLAPDMSEAEQDAVWTLVRYLREREMGDGALIAHERSGAEGIW